MTQILNDEIVLYRHREGNDDIDFILLQVRDVLQRDDFEADLYPLLLQAGDVGRELEGGQPVGRGNLNHRTISRR